MLNPLGCGHCRKSNWDVKHQTKQSKRKTNMILGFVMVLSPVDPIYLINRLFLSSQISSLVMYTLSFFPSLSKQVFTSSHSHACVDPEKNHKNIGFLSNTGLKNHKDIKPAFNGGPSSARQRNTISLVGR